MKTSIAKTSVALVTAALVLTATGLPAQTFTVLTNFTAGSGSLLTNQSGYAPDATLVLSGNTLYGMAYSGGANGDGTAFSVNTDGSDYTVLHTFAFTDGNDPGGSLLSDSVLYGTAAGGGANGSGTVFSLSVNNGSFSVLHDFAPFGYNAQSYVTNADGDAPFAGLVLSGNTLYGSTRNGGTNGCGTLFSVNTDNRDFKLLHVFSPGGGIFQVGGFTTTNEDGNQPNSTLVLIGDTLYGATENGGTNGWGTLFSVKTNGDDFQVFHNFSTAGDGGTNFDGAFGPCLAWSGTKLCGTTQGGGTNGSGVVFAVETNGSNYSILHTFKTAYYVNSFVGDTNADGAGPENSLTVSGNTFYGTTSDGGTNGAGTLFSIDADGSGFTLLHTMARIKAGIWADGEFPGQLVVAGDEVYGTASSGGSHSSGTIFSLALPSAPSLPLLSIASSPPGDSTLRIFWPDSATGFTLETTANLFPSATWTPLSNNIANDGTNFSLVITNKFDGSNHFYRLHGS